MNAGIIFEPLIPPLKIQIADIEKSAIIIVGILKESSMFLNRTK
jgi:hypothetical protein